MSSPTSKNIVGPRRILKREVRNVTPTIQNSETNDLFLSTASWPELPKSQNGHKHNRKISDTTERKVPDDIRTCNQSSASVKSQKEFSENRRENEQMLEMGTSLVLACSVKTNDENNPQLDSGNKDKTFPEEKQLSSNANQITATGIESANCSSSDGRRKSQAKKRSALKEEKKRIREAEILRKRIEPKGQSVKVISHKLLEMVLKSDKHSISVNTQQKCDIAGFNFPTLEEATKKAKTKSVKELSCTPENNENCTNTNPVASTVTSKKNKHKKPLEIDIHNLIKDSSRKSSDKGYKGHPQLRAKQNVPYIGNQLDSSNPERKRGKQRERPKKKKFTLLKTAILEARAIRKHLREIEEQSKSATDLPEVKICNRELNEPIKIDQHAQTQLSEECDHKEEAVNCEAIEENILTENKSSVAVAKVEVGLFQDVSISSLSHSEESSDCVSNLQQSKSLSGNQFSKVALRSSKENNRPLLGQDSDQKVVQHSRKFREYCDHILTKDLNSAVKSLIETIMKFQDRQYQRDPIKAFAKRRYVVGFREVKKYLQLKRLKLLIIAPDIETAKTKGGTDDAVAELKEMSNLQCLPYVFAMNRRTLGYVTLKKVGVSCIGVVSYEGAENIFSDIIEAMCVARMQYNKLVNNEAEIELEKEKPEETKDEVEKPEETKDEVEISACIAASLLAKLREKSTEEETDCRDKSSPFLAAIDRVMNSEEYTD